MIHNTKSMGDAPSSKQGTAILCLFDVSGQSMDWYWRKIAGVPFILRNILNIQSGGVHHLVVHASKPDELNQSCLSAIDSDSRVHLNLEWVFDGKQLAQSAQVQGNLIIFDGSALHSRVDVENALGTVDFSHKKTPFVFPLQNQTLKTLLENIDTFSLAGFEKILYEDLHSGFTGKKRNLIFMPGTNDTILVTEADFTMQHELLLSAPSRNQDSFLDRWITRSLTSKLTRFLINTSVTPNTIIGASFVLGLLSAFSLYRGSYGASVLGAVLLLVATWIGGAADEVARIKFLNLKAGGKLDKISGAIVHCALYLAVGFEIFTASGNVLYGYMGGLAALGRSVAFLVMWPSLSNHPLPWQANSKPSLVQNTVSRDFAYWLLFMALINQMEIFILAAAVLVNSHAIMLLYKKAQPTLIPIKNDTGE